MSRGLLPKSILEDIARRVPDVVPLRVRALQLNPDIISASFPKDSGVQEAAVCFHDVTNTLCEARYALHEYHANKVYYREDCQPPKEDEALFMERFYLDDTALRLYSAGEHLANAIRLMLDLTEDDLKPYKGKFKSRQAVVGKFLMTKRSDLKISKTIAALASSEKEKTCWQKAMNYRDLWVHEQPPLVHGTGIVYQRRKRWDISEDGSATLRIGGGDAPLYSVKNLADFIEPAFGEFVETVNDCLEYYTNLVAGGSSSNSAEESG